MKKFLSLVLAMCMVFALTACGSEQAATSTTETATENTEAAVESTEAAATETTEAAATTYTKGNDVPDEMTYAD